MALVVCPDCRREISSQAMTCPHCGRGGGTTINRMIVIAVLTIALFFAVFIGGSVVLSDLFPNVNNIPEGTNARGIIPTPPG